ncbi:MAG: histone deacetylase [Elusimicrobia bacterium CG11_big_fil_rev_8_21_14_0_20_64_6]|nr:MAG: histone deacetylase [Elusimicrobia bacterium CG11_big_fil_rev_8_21_14_0_20_64_6]
MKPRVVYSPEYEVDYGEHAFSTKKFRLAADACRSFAELVEPLEPSRHDLLLAHSRDWVEKLMTGILSPADIARLELPFSPEIARAHRLAAGGTLLAARHALETGVGLHAGGGAHHAFKDYGEGYCAVNDIAFAILRLRAEGMIETAAVIDLDVHQGNGTAAIFEMDPDTFTFSMHQDGLYPEIRRRSSLDIELRGGTGDAEYYDKLKHGLRAVMESKPDLVIYQAGVDVWERDRLGGLKLTESGIKDRDMAVYDICRVYQVPVAVTLGGGYGPTPEDTARLHASTLKLFVR